MAMNKSGLDMIKKFQTGGSTSNDSEKTETETKKEEPTVGVGQAPQSKSPYGLPKSKGLTAVDEGILERMQRMIDEREARKSGWYDAYADARAIWAGSPEMRAREEQREKEEATTFGMRRELAQYRVSQEANKRLLQGIMGDQEPAAAPAGGAAPSGAPAAGGAGMPTGGTGPLLNLVRDPDLRRTIAVQALDPQQGPGAALKSIQSYVAENAKDPDVVKQIRAGLREGWLTNDMVKDLFPVKFAGPEAFKQFPVTRTGPGGLAGDMPTTAIKEAAAMRGPQPAAPAPGIAPKPPAAAPAMPPAAAPAMPSAAAAPAAKPPVAPAPKPAAAPAPVAAGPAPLAKLPTAPEQPAFLQQTTKAGILPGSRQDIDIRQKAAEADIAAEQEQKKVVQKAAGESAVALDKAAGTAKQNILEYDMAENILKKYPKAFGISQDGSATAAVLNLVKPGTSIPILGTVKSEGAEEAIAQRNLPPKALAARRTFEAISTRQGVEFAKNNLTGEGRGTLSNADMKMAQVAKGLSTDNPAATNLIFTIMNRENEQMILERNNNWKKYKQEIEKSGGSPNFDKFKETEGYTKPMDDKDARIRKRFPEFFKDEPKAATTGGVRRYNPEKGIVE